jgi:E3 SUMO-protein ligase NSE2
MPRVNQSTVVSTLLDQVLQREKQDFDSLGAASIRFCKKSALRLAHDTGSLEQALKSVSQVSSDQSQESSRQREPVISAEQVQTLLQEQRERIKAVALKNVLEDRERKALETAILKLKADIDESGQVSDIAQYTDTLETYIQEESDKLNKPSLRPEKEALYQEVLLSMQDSSAIKPKAARRKRRSDDDIEVLPPANSAASATVKCPITQTYLEKPVKNKQCGHVYSKDAITSMIRTSARQGRNCSCPVAGCVVQQLHLEDLQDDVESEMAVTREKHRLQLENERRQAELMDSDEDEE